MADGRLPLLRGRIDRVDEFQAVFGGAAEPPPLPDRDPKKHRATLTRQLDRIVKQVERREEGVRVERATRELVAVKPEDKAFPAPDSLADKRSDARLISVDEKTGVALVDAEDPALPHLRRKLDWFADDKKVSKKTGARRSATAVAPISDVRLAEFDDLAGSRIREALPPKHAPRWFEIACRGGYRNDPSIFSRPEPG